MKFTGFIESQLRKIWILVTVIAKQSMRTMYSPLSTATNWSPTSNQRRILFPVQHSRHPRLDLDGLKSLFHFWPFVDDLISFVVVLGIDESRDGKTIDAA